MSGHSQHEPTPFAKEDMAPSYWYLVLEYLHSFLVPNTTFLMN